MGNFVSKYVTQIPDIEFISGDTITIPFKFTDANGTVIQSYTLVWKLCPYNDTKNTVITKTLTVTGGSANVVLSSEDTKKLKGKYVQQPVLRYTSGGTTTDYIRAYGYINVIDSIN
jgi:hypothetical protein